MQFRKSVIFLRVCGFFGLLSALAAWMFVVFANELDKIESGINYEFSFNLIYFGMLFVTPFLILSAICFITANFIQKTQS